MKSKVVLSHIVIILIMIAFPSSESYSQETGEWYQSVNYGLYRSDPEVELVTGIDIVQMMEKNFSEFELTQRRSDRAFTYHDYKNSADERFSLCVRVSRSVREAEDTFLEYIDQFPIYIYGPVTSEEYQQFKNIQYGDNMWWGRVPNRPPGIHFIHRNASFRISSTTNELQKSVLTILDTALQEGADFVTYDTPPEISGYTISRDNLEYNEVSRVYINIINAESTGYTIIANGRTITDDTIIVTEVYPIVKTKSKVF